jgi:hypothetical protein
MDAELKKTLKAVTLELRHLLEGRYDGDGKWRPGDLEQRLAAIGVRRDRASVPVDELGHLAEEDRQARRVVDAYLNLRQEAGVERTEAVAEFVRETAYTWANRLLALRCMEARELIDPVILQQEAYGGRSLEHHRLAQRHPELCAGDDDGLFAVLDKVFREQADRLPMLFDPQAPGITLRPSPATLKNCFGLLSLNPDTLRKYRIRHKEEEGTEADAEPLNLFIAPDALGWAYQYWNTEEKERVFEKVRTVKGAKIAGADIIPATQLYTESYMVKFLVQNSLGATWMGMHPESKLAGNWEYYVKDADRAPVEKKPVREITFLDPACGSGHFLLEAFDLLYAMYQEEGELTKPDEICDAILTRNLFGIDIDPRSVQIAEVALWMKAAERAFDYKGVPTNLVAATASHLKGEAWEEFLAGFEREPYVAPVLRKFAQTMERIDEIGSLARPTEDLREIIRQEHAMWERQVRERKEANYLFPEMNKAPTSGQLPFHEISDDDFGDRLFHRARTGIDAFTEQARESGEFEDQLLGSETRAGFRLVDLLSRRYDVVAANPPYMGSKNMGPTLKKFVERTFPSGKRDLYAAFILRNMELARISGRVAMVTQQSWMFLGSLEELRETILREHAIDALSQHGRYAFSEITNAVVQPVLCVIRIGRPSGNCFFTAFRLASPRASEDQARVLRDAIAGTVTGVSHSVQQHQFLEIPGATLCYWLRPNLMSLLRNGQKLAEFTTVKKGLDTADNARFVRFHWEVTRRTRRWHLFPKGGGYKRWIGFNWYLVDWEFDGARIKLLGRGTPRNEQFYGRSGLTYTEFGRGCLGARVLPTGAIFSTSFPGVFPCDEANRDLLHAILNCRLTSFYMRVLQANVQHLGEGYVPLVPVPPRASELQFPEVKLSLALSESLTSSKPVEFECDPQALNSPGSSGNALFKDYATAAILHTCETHTESKVLTAYSLSEEDFHSIFQEAGTPTGMFPLIRGYDSANLCLTPLVELSNYRFQFVTDGSPMRVEVENLSALKDYLKACFEAGPGTKIEESQNPDEDDDEDEGAAVGTRMPIPPETFLEELSQKLEIHPISVYWLLNEGVEKQGWRCLPEDCRLWSDRITVVALRLLGHRWPKQVEAREPVPDWAEPNGIIPLTPVAKESALFERVQERLRADEIDARDFSELVGKPIDAWLATEFFKHHTKQFKKRPIAWQLQSGKFTARRSPAFACLVYYHKLDGDTLHKLRAQYVGPLRQRLEIELRGIQTVAAEARSDRQEKRRTELEDAIEELTTFDAKLEQAAREGFATPGLKKLLESEPLDRWCSYDGKRPHPRTKADLIAQESAYAPDINDGVRVNIAPLQKAGLLAADVLAKRDIDKAIADRAQWRADERRWVREGKLPQPGWWPEGGKK